MGLHTVFLRNETDNVFCAPFPLVNPLVIIFFLLPMNFLLLMNKKLLKKDSSTEHFRR